MASKDKRKENKVKKPKKDKLTKKDKTNDQK